MTTSFPVFLFALISSLMLIVFWVKLIEHPPRSGAAVGCVLTFCAHLVLIVGFFKLTAGQAVACIGWVQEVILCVALLAVAIPPSWRRLIGRTTFAPF